MDKPSVWIVGHYGAGGGRLSVAAVRVPDQGSDYQTRLDAAQAELPADMRGCTHKVLARTGKQAIAVFHDQASYFCTDAGHGSDMRRIVPSA